MCNDKKSPPRRGGRCACPHARPPLLRVWPGARTRGPRAPQRVSSHSYAVHGDTRHVTSEVSPTATVCQGIGGGMSLRNPGSRNASGSVWCDHGQCGQGSGWPQRPPPRPPATGRTGGERRKAADVRSVMSRAWGSPPTLKAEGEVGSWQQGYTFEGRATCHVCCPHLERSLPKVWAPPA